MGADLFLKSRSPGICKMGYKSFSNAPVDGNYYCKEHPRPIQAQGVKCTKYPQRTFSCGGSFATHDSGSASRCSLVGSEIEEGFSQGKRAGKFEYHRGFGVGFNCFRASISITLGGTNNLWCQAGKAGRTRANNRSRWEHSQNIGVSHGERTTSASVDERHI